MAHGDPAGPPALPPPSLRANLEPRGYRDMQSCISNPGTGQKRTQTSGRKLCSRINPNMVDATGLEPVTPCV